MALQGREEVRALALYLEKAWDLRSTFLALQAAPQALQDQWRVDARNSGRVSGHVSSCAEDATAPADDDELGDSSDREIEQNTVAALGNDSDSEVVLEP
jgi:hypothetical protein